MTLLDVRRQYAFDTTNHVSHLSVGCGNNLFCGNGSPIDYSWQPQDNQPYTPCQYCEMVHETHYADMNFVTAEQIEESMKPYREWQASLSKPVQLVMPL